MAHEKSLSQRLDVAILSKNCRVKCSKNHSLGNEISKHITVPWSGYLLHSKTTTQYTLQNILMQHEHIFQVVLQMWIIKFIIFLFS